eukprot:725236-Amphidinium_carterae.1
MILYFGTKCTSSCNHFSSKRLRSVLLPLLDSKQWRMAFEWVQLTEAWAFQASPPRKKHIHPTKASKGPKNGT